MKRLALFCDGTWSDLGVRHPTNVARLARWVSPNGGGVPQIVGYESGVGVPTGVSALADGLVRLWGGALGRGLDGKIEAAYRFLCLNHEPGDEVFIFGFSRGAYTARSLCGLIRACGLLPRNQLHCAGEALAAYRRGERWKADPVEVRYLGLWDTVGSLGVPGLLTPRRYRFHDTEVSPLVRGLRHAVAIDERRKVFDITPVANIETLNQGAADLPYPERPYQQAWFPGDHGAVGGGEEETGLSNAALLWVAQGARAAGLALDQEQLGAVQCDPLADWNRPGLLALGGRIHRTGPFTLHEIDASAVRRWKARPDYRPEPLRRFTPELEASPRT